MSSFESHDDANLDRRGAFPRGGILAPCAGEPLAAPAVRCPWQRQHLQHVLRQIPARVAEVFRAR